jgi:hypothetical protein
MFLNRMSGTIDVLCIPPLIDLIIAHLMLPVHFDVEVYTSTHLSC